MFCTLKFGILNGNYFCILTNYVSHLIQFVTFHVKIVSQTNRPSLKKYSEDLNKGTVQASLSLDFEWLVYDLWQFSPPNAHPVFKSSQIFRILGFQIVDCFCVSDFSNCGFFLVFQDYQIVVVFCVKAFSNCGFFLCFTNFK